MYNKRFVGLILACFISVSFYLPAVLAEEIIIEEIEVSNLEAASGKPYVVGEEGLKVGSVYHIDRGYTIVSMSEELEGATFIRTALEDGGNRSEEFITFTVKVPVVVWVCTDRRGEEEKGGTPPGWLSADEGWEERPEIVLEASDGDLGFFFVRSKEFPAGEVVLGANAAPPAAGQDPNYIPLLTLSPKAAVEATDKLSTTWAELKSKN